MWVMWNLLFVHLEIVLVSVQDRCMVCAKRTTGSETVFNAPMVLLGDKCKLVSVCLEIVLIMTQDKCTLSAKRTVVSEIVLDAPDGTSK